MQRSQQSWMGRGNAACTDELPTSWPFWRLVVLTALILAATIPSGPVSAGINTWTSIGPDGGYINSLAVDPANPSTLYAGTFEGEVFKSIDGSATWSVINTSLTTAINALAIDPTTPTTLYAAAFGGVLKTIDEGATWSVINTGLTNIYVQALAIDPKNPSTLYAGTWSGGLFKSTNGGASWSAINAGLTAADIRAVAIDPQTHSTLYVGTYGGMFKSTNAGASWNAINAGLTAADIRAVAIDPQTPSTLYAGTFSSGIFRSTNGGASWTAANTGLTSTSIEALAINPTTPSTLYAGTLAGGIFKSTNGGAGWITANNGLTDISVQALAINPTTSDTLYAGTDGGVFKSTSGGAGWAVANTGLRATQVYALAIDPQTPSTLYAATWFNGVFKSIDSGGSWLGASAGLTQPVYTLAINPQTPSVLYAGTSGGVYKSINSGTSWSPANTGLLALDIYALAIDPTIPNILYAGMFGRVYKSTDGGASWSDISAGLPNTYVRALVIDPITPSTLFAGTANGVFKSTNGGASWNTSNAGLAHTDVQTLAIDSIMPSTLYAGTGGGVFKSVNGGTSWNASNTGLAHTGVQALAIDPITPSTLYAGTGGGVFKSTDSGGSWGTLNTGLTNTHIRALAIAPVIPAILYAGTYGSGAFAFENIDDHSLTYATVIDQQGRPIAGAWVYQNGRRVVDAAGKPRVTDSFGDMILEGVRPGDALVALAPVYKSPTVRQGHNGSAYQVYVTNMTVGAHSHVRPFTVTTPTGSQLLTVRPQNTLVLFNLVVSIEWNADAAYLPEIVRAVRAASDFLFDVSDGQMAFGEVTIYDNAEHWANADIQIVASNIVRPHAHVGGIGDGDRAHVIRLGRAWDGNSGNQGHWDAPDGYRTLTHEFGHYALYLRDEYFGYLYQDGIPVGERLTSCTGPSNRNRATEATNASIMDNQYTSSELAMRGVAGMWSNFCEQTAQWQINHESDWETLARKYADQQTPSRWQLMTPADRGNVLAGPVGLPPSVLNLPTIATHQTRAGEPPRQLTVYQPDGSALRNAIVALYRQGQQGGRVIGQGLTDNNGRIDLYGASQGDNVRAASFNGALAGEVSVTAASSLTIILGSVGGLAVQISGEIPHLQVVAIPSQTPDQVALLIELNNFDSGVNPSLLVTVPGSQVGYAPVLSHSPGSSTYVGQISFDATERGTGRIQVAGKAGGGLTFLQTTYRLQRVVNAQGYNIFSNDGSLDLRLEAGALPGNETFVVVMPPGAIPGPLPGGLTLLGEPYDITVSGAATLLKPAVLSLHYDKALVSGTVPPAGLKIYRWDPANAAWQAVGDTIDPERRAVTAQVTALGTYALLAPPGSWAAARLEVFLPLVRR
jgi:photosystem II stability/assembly factor-like uncharacterized protein